MTNEQCSRLLATMFAATPGGMGMMGIMVGIDQGRIGPIVVGVGLVLVAMYTYNLFTRLTKPLEDKK
jgi:hypothetical protein